MGVLPFTLSYGAYNAIYNALSFVMASMGASTFYFFFHACMMPTKGPMRSLRTALCITGLVTLIAFYHYWRIFNSWVEAYEFHSVRNGTTEYGDLKATGKPFNDAYRYMDWLLTVPLLLIELIMVMRLDDETTNKLCLQLGTAAAVMIMLGYPGEITMTHSTRWIFWFLAMIPFVFIVYTLFIGLKDGVDRQPEGARALVSAARWVTVISWCTYPIVYILPMIGADTGESALVGIQIGYSISDFISKCGLGVMVTKIAMAKYGSGKEVHEGLLEGQH